MKKYHALYDWISTEVLRLSSSDTAEAYASTLTDQNEEIYVPLSEELRGLGAELVTAKNNRAHFSQWQRLKQNINNYSTRFSNFPQAEFHKLRTCIMLASTLSTTGEALDEDEINDQLFEVRALSKPLPLNWFARENSTTFENSLVVFSCQDFPVLERELQASTGQISPKLVFHILATLVQSQNLPASHVALIKHVQPQIPNETVEAFVHLHILAEGKDIHIRRHYSALPQIGNFDETDPLHPYHQWNDVLGVLSEYNSRTEPLLKFLTIYHVVENLMFKRPLVELESRQNGRMFSIRSFRQMYDQVEMNESIALRKLFITSFQVQITRTATVEQSILMRWQNLSNTASVPDIDSALMELGMNKTYAQFAPGNGAASFFSDLVYKLRCAIVHNKETEFHLTYSTMTNGFITLIESFLLPALEELCFVLISRKNPYVWYSNRELKLY
jgi:hypothetical protein